MQRNNVPGSTLKILQSLMYTCSTFENSAYNRSSCQCLIHKIRGSVMAQLFSSGLLWHWSFWDVLRQTHSMNTQPWGLSLLFFYLLPFFFVQPHTYQGCCLASLMEIRLPSGMVTFHSANYTQQLCRERNR